MDITWLTKTFRARGDAPAIIWNDAAYSFAELSMEIDRWRTQLHSRQMVPGDVVAVDSEFSPAACALLLALIENDNIIVPLSSAVSENKDQFLRIAAAQHVVVIRQDRLESHAETKTDVSNGYYDCLRQRGHPGLVLFSSGSTGEPKAAVHDFSNILQRYHKPGTGRRTLTFLLFDHIGGINTLLYVLASGGTIVTTEQRDPESVCTTIARHRVQLLPTSPTFLTLLLMSEAYARHDLSSLELITYGTEPMPESTLTALNRILPDVDFRQTYGLSEVGIMHSKSRDSSSLWVKVGGRGYETKIVDGILWIRSDSAMLGYLNAPSPFDEEGWLNTGDYVEVDGEYIRFLGRESEIINVGGEKVYPAEVESVLLQMDNVRDAVIRGKANPITGNVVTARVSLHVPEESSAFKKRMWEFCQTRLERFKIPAVVHMSDEKSYSDRFKKMRR